VYSVDEIVDDVVDQRFKFSGVFGNDIEDDVTDLVSESLVSGVLSNLQNGKKFCRFILVDINSIDVILFQHRKLQFHLFLQQQSRLFGSEYYGKKISNHYEGVDFMGVELLDELSVELRKDQLIFILELFLTFHVFLTRKFFIIGELLMSQIILHLLKTINTPYIIPSRNLLCRRWACISRFCRIA